MKSPQFSVALLAALVLSSATLRADDDTAAATNAAVRPVPVHIVNPDGLPARFINATVKVTFILDETGTPHEVRPVGRMPRDLAKQLLPALAQWKFTPMVADGKPVRVRVIMPLLLSEAA